MIEVNQQASMVGALRAPEYDSDEVDRIIERRAKDKSPKDAANEREAIWKASEAAHHAEHREARRHMWIGYYRRLSESFRRRSEECAERAAALDPGESGS
jgi:hypothetical protein